MALWLTGSVSGAGGLMQRVATTVGDVWFVVIALALLRHGDLRHAASQRHV